MIYLHAFGRTLFSFALLWGLTRILGKKQISQLTLFDYITGISVGGLTANLIAESNHWRPVAFSLALWGLLAYGFQLLDLRGRSMHRFFDDEPTILIRHGKVMEENLKKLHLTVQSLESMLRVKGYFDLEQVEFAILETDGQMSVLPRSQFRPLQPHDIGVSTSYEGLATQVMQEGRGVAHGLQQVGLDEAWLQAELARMSIPKGDVFAAWLASNGALVVDRYHDRPGNG
jgi:uncharacterized membrane protein YcaP (DUF421 family)